MCILWIHEEYVQFGLISMDKVHMGHMCVWVFEMQSKCVFIMDLVAVSHLEYIGLHIWRYFAFS